jgi:hypothetical protein
MVKEWLSEPVEYISLRPRLVGSLVILLVVHRPAGLSFTLYAQGPREAEFSRIPVM